MALRSSRQRRSSILVHDLIAAPTDEWSYTAHDRVIEFFQIDTGDFQALTLVGKASSHMLSEESFRRFVFVVDAHPSILPTAYDACSPETPRRRANTDCPHSPAASV